MINEQNTDVDAAVLGSPEHEDCPRALKASVLSDRVAVPGQEPPHKLDVLGYPVDGSTHAEESTKHITAAPAPSPAALEDQHVREFIGWLSADIPELHHVEVPRLAASYERFKRRASSPSGAPPEPAG